MRPRTLRLRVVLAAAVVLAVTVAALGLSVGLLIAHQLRSSLDRSLLTRGEDVARLAVSVPALLTAPGALDASAGGRQLAVEVVDRHGRIVARSAALGGRLLPGGRLLAAALSRGVQGVADTRLSGQPIRLLVVPVADAGGPAAGGAVLVSADSTETRDTLHQLGTLIALSAVAAAALGALATTLLVARGLGPLARLSVAAREIARTGDASRRLPAPDTHDELAGLARTLNTMLATLERAQQTERRFLADASHELRTPVTSLRGNLAYLSRHGLDADALADAEADARRLARLVDDLLRLEREGGADPAASPVALDQLARSVAAREGARLTICEPVAVRGDPLSLERALANLIENAHQHGPPGAEVSVEVRALAGGAELAVSDQGPGPAVGDRERVFDRFWRGPEAAERPGTGLGLALVSAIAARHGGSVRVQGSRFALRLPTFKESSEDAPTL